MSISTRRIQLLCMVGIAICVGIVVSIGMSVRSNVAAISTMAHGYEVRWNLDLPNDIKEVYHATSDHGFHGDGLRYTVYEPGRFIGGILSGGTKDKNEEMERWVNIIEENLTVAPEQRIDFSQEQLWQVYREEDNKLYVLWSAETGRLTFAEWLQ